MPVGHRYLVRTLRLVNYDASLAATVRWGIGFVSGATQLGRAPAIAAGTSFTDSTWFVLNAGESLMFAKDVGSGTVSASVHGYDLASA